MQCPICDASIDEIEASTCPLCGFVLSQPIFPEEEERLLDGHDGNIVSLDDFRVGRRAQEFEREAVPMASDEEEFEAELNGESVPVLHHPSSGRKPRPVRFFKFKVHLHGKVHEFWVRSTAKTAAVENLLTWILDQGWRPTDSVGDAFPWGLAGQELAIKYKAEMPLMEPKKKEDGTRDDILELPGDVTEYIDAYYRDKPKRINMRD